MEYNMILNMDKKYIIKKYNKIILRKNIKEFTIWHILMICKIKNCIFLIIKF